jgi:hypothetical protein
MKTLLKILLVVFLLLIAIKLSPVIFVLAAVGMLVAAVLGVIGLSLAGAVCAVVVAAAVALSPIWIPVLAVVGVISLFRRKNPPAITA